MGNANHWMMDLENEIDNSFKIMEDKDDGILKGSSFEPESLINIKNRIKEFLGDNFDIAQYNIEDQITHEIFHVYNKSISKVESKLMHEELLKKSLGNRVLETTVELLNTSDRKIVKMTYVIASDFSDILPMSHTNVVEVFTIKNLTTICFTDVLTHYQFLSRKLDSIQNSKD